MAKSFVAKNGIIGAVALVGLTGCSSISNMIEPNKIDYKSAGKVTTASLEVPPDLTQIRRDNRFAIPDANKSSATASGYNLEKGVKPPLLPRRLRQRRLKVCESSATARSAGWLLARHLKYCGHKLKISGKNLDF
jgi:uncharacterized lipoprotein